MEIVDLVRGDRRSLKYCQSCVGKDSLVRLARGPVLAGHVAVVGGRSSPGDAVALIVCAHAVEAVAACQLSFEVINA